MTDNLLAMTALELAECYERGDASPVEMAQATFDQIDRHNGTLNCICLIDEETTLDMARASEARWQKGEPIGPLDGVPVTIKDLTLTKGWPTLRGSKTTDPAGPWDED
ncbi:MAG: amidase family protein, partial [Alphaproteobacteria bacterium]|nr:amidase family protein [Alphaproteobacteria bacterium]